jgi:hypothetical protein
MRLNGNSTWDIGTIPVRLNFTVVVATTMTLLSNLIANTFSNEAGVTLAFSGAYDVDITTLQTESSVTASIVRMVAGQTLTVGAITLCGCIGAGTTLNSVTPGSRFNLVYTGTLGGAHMARATLTDINVTSTTVKLYNWNGTVSNCSIIIKAVGGNNIGSAGVSVTTV